MLEQGYEFYSNGMVKADGSVEICKEVEMKGSLVEREDWLPIQLVNGWNGWLAGWLDTPPVCFESGGSLTLLLSCHLPVPPEWQEGEGCTNLGIASPASLQIRGCLSFRQLTVCLRLSWKLILKTERKVICLKVWSWTSGFMYRGAVFSGRIGTFDICSQTLPEAQRTQGIASLTWVISSPIYEPQIC